MKKIKISLMLASIIVVSLVTLTKKADSRTLRFSGTVERVWDDGFALRTQNKNLIVDAWDLCGDRTFKYISVGDILVVTGEYEQGEFDAFSLKNSNQQEICPHRYKD